MMHSIIRNKNLIAAVRKIIAAIIWLGVWQVIYLAVGQEILVVSPARVFQRILELATQTEFWLDTFNSMIHVLEGFAAGVVVGAILAPFTVKYRFLNDLFRPLLNIVKATPVASFIILVLVWIPSAYVPVFIAFLMVLPVVWGNIGEGIRKIDRNLLEMADCYRFGKWKTFQRVTLPSVMPYLVAACTTSLGLAWKAGIAAEVLSHAKYSIGGEIYDAKIYLETLDVFAWTAVVILLSVLLEKLMVCLVRAAGKKYNVEAEEKWG